MKTLHIPKNTLPVVAIVLSLATAGFSTAVYLTAPQRLAAYVQAHRTQFVGPKGPQGPQGVAGIDGTNGINGSNGVTTVEDESSPSTCNTFYYTDTASTSCY
jgi:hypothetical protein